MSLGNFDTANITKQTTLTLWAIALISIGLGIGGFITPPPGEIHKSVLQFCAFLGGIGVLAVIREAIKEGRGIRVRHHDTTVEVNHLDDSNNTDNADDPDNIE